MNSLFLFALLAQLVPRLEADQFDATHIRSHSLPPGASPSRVGFVDRNDKGNFLFRMGEPKVGLSVQCLTRTRITLRQSFAYKEIQTNFPLVATQHNVTLPSDYYLVDICLLTLETWDIQMEKDFFAENPEKGKIITWPIYGLELGDIQRGCEAAGIPKARRLVRVTARQAQCNSQQPRDYAPEVVKQIALQMPTMGRKDNVTGLFKEIAALYSQKHDKPYVIFWHCECGCDRAGEISANYVLEHLHWNFTTAMVWNEAVPKRHIVYSNQVHIQWYCEFLHATGRSNATDCGNCQPFQC